MDNFYTSTVYSKGAEVIRMYSTLLGTDGFRKGMDLYFERHDGQAVACDDFRAAMSDANGQDLTQFENWYLQSGTPIVSVSANWSEEFNRYTLRFQQSCPDTPGQSEKQPFHIPISMGLLGPNGEEFIEARVLELKEWEQEFVFDNLPSEPTPSLLRNFSAPVRLRFDWTEEQLAFLMANDSDSFQRWEAGQMLYSRVILSMVDQLRSGEDLQLNAFLSNAFHAILSNKGMDPSLKAYALTLPDEATLAEEMEVVHPDELHECRRFLMKSLAAQWRTELEFLYAELAPEGPFVHSPSEAGRRRLRNLALGYLSSLETEDTLKKCRSQMDSANNMTDQFAALSCLTSISSPISEKAVLDFYTQWKGDPLVVDKWLAVQASAARKDTCERVEALRNHEAFDIKNPNKARSLIRCFFRNLSSFHRADGFGYQWVADRVIELNALNPQIAARMAGAFASWKRMDSNRQALIKEQLVRIQNEDELSKDLMEIIQKTLNA
jgi:aminopeptidase N